MNFFKSKPYKKLAKAFSGKMVMSEAELKQFCGRFKLPGTSFYEVVVKSEYVVNVADAGDPPSYVMSVAAFSNEQNRKSLLWATIALCVTIGLATTAILVDFFELSVRSL